MDNDWITKISKSIRKTPIKVWVKEKVSTDLFSCLVGENSTCFMGEQALIDPFISKNELTVIQKECSARNSAIELLDISQINARIEYGSIIRKGVEIEDNAVILMGAVLNVGAHIGKGSMIDMNAVIGSRAWIGKECHIGAGAVISGVLEPASAIPVVIEDHVFVGANATILEGVHIHEYAVIAAGSVVIKDVQAGMVVAGVPSKVIKHRSEISEGKVETIAALRYLE